MSLSPLILDATEDTPRIKLDPASNVYELIGNSYPENSTKFYTPILDWFRAFFEDGQQGGITVDFSFDYFNTSSAKYILEILRFIQDYHDTGKACAIRWHYFEDDTDMLEAGEDYQASLTVPFELIERTDTY
ncbi:MAG: DUF1987 domain-containing protein [Bacteroidetes bacterium]|nr:DUF1987 domain-containing protein [Bacteroidota bacterium]